MIEVIWGILLTALTLIGWIGQIIYAISPRIGAKFGVGESKSDVDNIFYIDARGEAIWDSIILWTLPLAGVLLIFKHPHWPYFALLGGGSYLYFSGRNVVTRPLMQRHGIRIGTTNNIRTAYIFLPLLGLAALITIVMAVLTLTGV